MGKAEKRKADVISRIPLLLERKIENGHSDGSTKDDEDYEHFNERATENSCSRVPHHVGDYVSKGEATRKITLQSVFRQVPVWGSNTDVPLG